MERKKAVKFITAIMLAVTLSLSLVVACPPFSITSKADGPSDPNNKIVSYSTIATSDASNISLLPGQIITRTVAFNLTLQLAPYTGFNTTFHLTVPRDADPNVKISFSNVRAAKMGTTGTYPATLVRSNTDSSSEFVSDGYTIVLYNNTPYISYDNYTIYVDVEFSNTSSFEFHTGYGGFASTSPANSASMKAKIEGYIKDAGATLGDKVTLALTYTNYLLQTNFGNLHSDGYIKNQAMAGYAAVSLVREYDMFIGVSPNEFSDIHDNFYAVKTTLSSILNAVTALNTNTLLQESQNQTAELEKQTEEAKKQTEEQKKQTEALTKYENADKMDTEAGNLTGVIDDYDKVSDSIFESAGGGIADFDITVGFDFGGKIIAAIGLLGTIMTNIILSMGDFSMLYTVGVCMALVGILTGLYKYFVSEIKDENKPDRGGKRGGKP